ncbi:hypothetical protein ACFYVL_27285 [Streptomyces sp. NPDC004111]|uniref:hypothetical protein n=1 Tax=Streptomyces sp. NPDC004111 TaxID=3364690 RepID=UPI0036AF8F4C
MRGLGSGNGVEDRPGGDPDNEPGDRPGDGTEVLSTGPAGRSGRGGVSQRGFMAVSTTAVAGLAAVGLFAVSCGTGGTGTRDEGPARSDPVAAKVTPQPRSSASASDAMPAERIDPVELLKNDPKVSETVKQDLKPCVKDIFPVDASYGRVTANGSDDVVVNVMTCADAVGIGSYVFREEQGRYKNVFVAEEPAVYAEIDRGDLVVTRPQYKQGDAVAFPSGEVVVTYRWTGDRFTEHDRVENSYSKAVGNGDGNGEKQSAEQQETERLKKEAAEKAAGERAGKSAGPGTTPSAAPTGPADGPTPSPGAGRSTEPNP